MDCWLSRGGIDEAEWLHRDSYWLQSGDFDLVNATVVIGGKVTGVQAEQAPSAFPVAVKVTVASSD